MPEPVKTAIDQPPAPVNGDPMTPGATRRLGIYFVLLGLTLLYLTFVIWPPDYQSLPSTGTKEEDKGKNPASPIVFFDCAPCLLKTEGKAEPSPGSRDAAGATPSAPDAVSSSPQERQAAAAKGETKGGSLAAQTSGGSAHRCRWSLCVTYDQRLFLLVLILGALGSYIHAVMSFADYAGNRRLVQSWLWWYLLRPFTGAPTALVLYFAVRAGFMTPTATGGDVSRFGIAALAMLAGMFSMKAADKLEEVFDVLFKTQEKRKDSLENVVPVLRSINPPKVISGSGAQSITLEGSDFSAKAVVLFDNTERVASVVSATKLTLALTAEDVMTARTIKIAVKNPPPGGGTSSVISFTVEARI